MAGIDGLSPTDEQIEAVDVALRGDDLAIEAMAGTGKTSTLVLIAHNKENFRANGTYLAFNKAIVRDAKKAFPPSVECSTVHSLAFRAIGNRYKRRFNAQRMRSSDIARKLSVRPVVVRTQFGDKRLSDGFLAGLALKGVREFCRTADEAPTWEHLPTPASMEASDELLAAWQEVARSLEPAMLRAWDDMQDERGELPYDQGCYLKMWQLSRPSIHCDYLLVDECQDLNGVMLAIAQGQQDHAQLIAVGDACQPPGTMVQVVVGEGPGAGRIPIVEDRPIEQLRAGDAVVSWSVSKSHLFTRGSAITGITMRPYVGDLICVKAGPDRSRYTPDHRCVVRIRDAFAEKHLVYVMRKGASFRVGRATGRYGSQGNAFGPMLRAHKERADGLWILGAYDTSEAAAAVEALASYRFGVPMMLFTASGNRLMSQPSIDDFWLKMGDLSEQGAALLAAHGRDIRFPLWEAGQETMLIRRAQVMRACNVMDGMTMRSVAEADWIPVATSREHYTGPVYSMDVADHHTYVADGLVTHNCQQIYEWNGSLNAMAQLDVANRVWLTRSFRFGSEIAEVANLVLSRLTDKRIIGAGKPGTVGRLSYPDAVLARTNAAAVNFALREIVAGGAPHIVGGAEEVVAFAKGALDLQRGMQSWHPDLACFSTWNEVRLYVETDELGQDIKLLVSLIDEFGAQVIIDALEDMPEEDDASVLISTAHKSKGRQFPAVQLTGDFPDEDAVETISQEEYRLQYVAVTRARSELDVSAVGWLTPVPA